MKISLSVRSDVAFNLLTRLLEREEMLPDVQFYQRNSSTLRDLEDAIEFYRADLYIVDLQLMDADVLVDVLSKGNHEYLVIENDVKAVMPQIIEKFGVQPVVPELKEIHYEREEKERIVIKEKVIEKEVIRMTYQALPSKVVIVGSLSRGAGSTILATNLARMTAKRGIDVAYIEHPLIRPYMFDYLQIHLQEQMDNGQPYIDIGNEIQQEGIARTKSNTFARDGIKWHVNDSRIPQVPSFSYENMLVLTHAVQANVLIIDISDRWLDPEIQKFLYLADTILMCVEPDPIKYEWSLYGNGASKQREGKAMDWLLEQKLNNFELVLMKNVKGIDIKMLKSIMHKKPIVSLPYIPYQDIQQALFQSKLIYDYKEHDRAFEESLIPVIAKFLPKDFVEIKNRDKGFLNRFKSKKSN